MQINNLKIKYSKLYNRYQVITLKNKTVLEEFETEEQAINCAKQIEDFTNKKIKNKIYEENKKMERINENEEFNVKVYGNFVEYLQARYDSRADFYKKAIVKEYDGIIYLQSYDTIVAKIENGKAVVNGWYSQTTARHINEFLLQNGFEKMSKKEMEA